MLYYVLPGAIVYGLDVLARIFFAVRARPQLVCFPTNWVDEGRDDIHRYWANQLRGWDGWLLAADRWGEEDGIGFWGRSAILKAGEVRVEAGPEGDCWRGTPVESPEGGA